ncbi:MAG: hypothetical protein IAE91_07830 [Ignavibacteriaceae bacterium]|nr:hypothetical protein [Ignavibacteriaceae bacterium]
MKKLILFLILFLAIEILPQKLIRSADSNAELFYFEYIPQPKDSLLEFFSPVFPISSDYYVGPVQDENRKFFFIAHLYNSLGYTKAVKAQIQGRLNIAGNVSPWVSSDSLGTWNNSDPRVSSWAINQNRFNEARLRFLPLSSNNAGMVYKVWIYLRNKAVFPGKVK